MNCHAYFLHYPDNHQLTYLILLLHIPAKLGDIETTRMIAHAPRPKRISSVTCLMRKGDG